jgi:hypothetical protein
VSDALERPLADAARRLRRPPGRPRRVTTGPTIGCDIQRAPVGAASSAAMGADFAATLLPRGLPLPVAADYSGIPVRRLWQYLASGRLHAIRPPGCRRVLLDRRDLDRLLDEWKQAPAPHAAGADEERDRG